MNSHTTAVLLLTLMHHQADKRAKQRAKEKERKDGKPTPTPGKAPAAAAAAGGGDSFDDELAAAMAEAAAISSRWAETYPSAVILTAWSTCCH
jgi:hypothetical protein